MTFLVKAVILTEASPLLVRCCSLTRYLDDIVQNVLLDEESTGVRSLLIVIFDLIFNFCNIQVSSLVLICLFYVSACCVPEFSFAMLE